MAARVITREDAGARPTIPRATRLAWRLAPLADGRRIDFALRLAGAGALPIALDRGRLAAMGLPEETTGQTLRRIRRVRDWDLAWTWAAQRFLGEARAQTRIGDEEAAALHQRHAALAYHLAGMLVFDDPREMRALRASATTLFARAAPVLHPAVRRVEIPWRTTRLPGYLVHPDGAEGLVPLAVFLNGASTSKEETLLWSDAFLAAGIAVLALDWPGSGESALHMAPAADCDDLFEGIVDLAQRDPDVDAARIGLIGFSLGGAIAARIAAADRRVAAVVAVTPPYDPRAWMRHAQPLLLRQLNSLAGGVHQARRLAAEFAVAGTVARTRCPVLVIGAGRDLIVPPEEALRFCAEAGVRGTLLWYPDGGHGLYEELVDWTAEAARWLEAVTAGMSPSTWVDAPVPICVTTGQASP